MAYEARNDMYLSPHPEVIATQPNMPSQHITNMVVNNLPCGQHAHRMRKWSTQLCGCCEDCSSSYTRHRCHSYGRWQREGFGKSFSCTGSPKPCFLAMLFPPCFSCYLASRMGEMCCLPICVPESLMALRVKLRAGNNIEGSICGDCLLTTFCTACAMCQIKRELDNIEKGKLPI